MICVNVVCLASVVVAPLLLQQKQRASMERVVVFETLYSATTTDELREFYSKQSLPPAEVVESIVGGRTCVIVWTNPFSGRRASRLFVYTGPDHGVLRFSTLLSLDTIDEPVLAADDKEKRWVISIANREIMGIPFDFNTW